MAMELAPIFVNDARVRLGGDPAPRVTTVVKAAGEDPRNVRVMRLREPNDSKGTPLSLEEIIDRSSQDNPVYLRLLREREGHAATDPTRAQGV